MLLFLFFYGGQYYPKNKYQNRRSPKIPKGLQFLPNLLPTQFMIEIGIHISNIIENRVRGCGACQFVFLARCAAGGVTLGFGILVNVELLWLLCFTAAVIVVVVDQ